jgi:hypothetical protein
MFTDPYHLVRTLEHEYREENGNQVHSYQCLRCQLTVRLNTFKMQVRQLCKDIDFAIGEPIEKDKNPGG